MPARILTKQELVTPAASGARRRPRPLVRLSSFFNSHGSDSDLSAAEVKVSSLPKKKVRFQVDGHDKVLSTVHLVQATQEHEKVLYYATKEGITSMKQTARTEAQMFAKEHRELLDSIDRLLDSPVVRKRLSQDSISEAQAIEVLTQSESRGLEMRMSKNLWRHQKWAIRSILTQYFQLADCGSNYVDAALRTHCLYVSRCSQELARSLAIGDEMEARKIYQESFE